MTKDHPLKSRWVYAAIVVLALDSVLDHSLEIRSLVDAVIITLAFIGGKLSVMPAWKPWQ